MTYRTAAVIPAQLQTRDDAQNLTISGYFSVFNSPYEFSPGCREFVDPHAFDDALGDDIRALINHDTRLVLGRTAANTLHLRTDTHGLYGEIAVNRNDTEALNLYYRVQRGDVSQCSFGFDILNEEYALTDSGADWTILAVKLYEVSVCTFPAYAGTNVQARDALRDRQAQIDALRKQRLDEQRNELRNILHASANNQK